MLNFLLAAAVVLGFALVVAWPVNRSRWDENRAAIVAAIQSTQPLASSFQIQREASLILGRCIGTTPLFVHLAALERSSIVQSAWEETDSYPRRRLYRIGPPSEG